MKETLKHLLIVVLLFFAVEASYAQTFWTDNFNNGCAANCLATTWNGWTVTDNVGGTTGGAPNNWFVSCAEEGITPPGCGSSCIGDASLHIGANPGAGGDMGASFNETGATNATFRRAVSPTISSVGYSTITLNFDFIAYGSAACSDDRAQLHLSTDNGATWPVGYQYCLTSVCCGACNGYSQGQWTLYSLALPAAFNNNANIRVAFHWRNNGNGSGTDPSVAIDDIRLTAAVVLSVDLLSFDVTKDKNVKKLEWKTSNEMNFKEFEIEHGYSISEFTKIGSVKAKSSGDAVKKYQFVHTDQQANSTTSYYRLKMIDNDGSFKYSKTIATVPGHDGNAPLALLNHYFIDDKLTLQLLAEEDMNVDVDIFDLKGKLVLNSNNYSVSKGESLINMDLGSIAVGTFFVRVNSPSENKTAPLNYVTQKIVKR